jgi:formiminotetrahydrofolate cyclodeaminase
MLNMPESLWDLSLRAALAETASPSPTPGGGSVAPLTGAFGLGLVLMALEVTQAKKPGTELTCALETGRALLAELALQPDRDVAVFQAYMQAVALPRQSAAEQATRDAARQRAATNAADVPLTAADVCLRALAFAESVAGFVQKNVLCDLIAGADLLFGALRAVLRTLDVNLPALKDPELQRSLASRAQQLNEQAQVIYARIC